MVSSTKAYMPALWTTANRPTSVPNGTRGFNTTLQKEEYTSDNGTTWVQGATEDFVTSEVSAITPASIGAPQTDGTGATGAWGIDILGNSATATSISGAYVEDISGTANQINISGTAKNPILSTPQNIDTGASVEFNSVQMTQSIYEQVGTTAIFKTWPAIAGIGALIHVGLTDAQNSASSLTNYLEYKEEIENNASGSESLKISWNVVGDGLKKEALAYSGESEELSTDGDFRVNNQIIYDTIVAAQPPFDQVGSTKRIVSDDVMTEGALCKVSTLTDFRIQLMTALDTDSTGIICQAKNAVASVGDIAEVVGLDICPVILNTVAARGELLKKSAAVDGRVVASGAVPGAFCVALESGAVGDTITAAYLKNEVF
jgi:hypothetical protein